MKLIHHDSPQPASYGICTCRTCGERRWSNRLAAAAAGCLLASALPWVGIVQAWGPALVKWLGW